MLKCLFRLSRKEWALLMPFTLNPGQADLGAPLGGKLTHLSSPRSSKRHIKSTVVQNKGRKEIARNCVCPSNKGLRQGREFLFLLCSLLQWRFQTLPWVKRQIFSASPNSPHYSKRCPNYIIIALNLFFHNALLISKSHSWRSPIINLVGFKLTKCLLGGHELKYRHNIRLGEQNFVSSVSNIGINISVRLRFRFLWQKEWAKW